MSEFKKDSIPEEINCSEPSGDEADILINPGSVESPGEEIVEMRMKKESRGELFLKILDSIKKEVTAIEDSRSGKDNILVELDRLGQSYEQAYFADNIVKEENCWLILKGYEKTDLISATRIMEGIEKSLGNEKPKEDNEEEKPVYH
jgi:hypothetical protein